MGSTSINSAINTHVTFYSSANSYSNDSLNEDKNYSNFPQTGQQNSSPTSNDDLPPITSDLTPSKLIFNYELAFTNYLNPNNCDSSEFKETKETSFETNSPLMDNENSDETYIAATIESNSPTAIADICINGNNIDGVTLENTAQNENQSLNGNVDYQSDMALKQSEDNYPSITNEITNSQQPSNFNAIQEKSSGKVVSLYSIDSIDLTIEEEADIIVNPSIFKPKVKDPSDQSPDQESKSSDSDTGSPSKKITKKRKKQRKNYFAPPKKVKPKAKKVEEEEENVLNLTFTDELDMITKENTEKNIISLREKNYVTVIKKTSEKNDEELDNEMNGNISGDDSDFDEDAPKGRAKKSRKITWNTTPQYKEFHKNQSITLGERFCSPVKPKTEQPKKSCLSRRAPFNSPSSKMPKKSRSLSPVTVTRIIYSKK